ncbi:MAG TPA: hypothetical protein VFV65_00170 [Gemmatimonadales bacterium]|nr:hypothetical protein [Gemmatimonadales bacterium]
MRTRLAGLLLCGALGATPVLAQDPTPARAADVGTIDSIITTLYAVISGPAGQPRQWDRFFTLMHPQARLIPTGCDTAGTCRARIMTPVEYRERADSLLVALGFTERELHRKTERYGAIAQSFSAYESFRHGEDKPFARGINSIQLFWDGTRWWVMNIFWDSERANNPLPAEYQ